MVGRQRLAVRLVGEERAVVLERRERHVRREALLRVRDDEPGSRPRLHELCELAKLVEPKPTARFVVAHAEQGFTSNMPLDAIEDENALIAYEADGEPLTPDHGWPLRLVVPSRYFWKSAKWLRGLEFSDLDRPGFWEGYGYHNDADPWKEERYGF